MRQEAKGKLGKKLRRLNARISDWDRTQANLKSATANRRIPPEAYRKPGSMKTHG